MQRRPVQAQSQSKEARKQAGEKDDLVLKRAIMFTDPRFVLLCVAFGSIDDATHVQIRISMVGRQLTDRSADLPIMPLLVALQNKPQSQPSLSVRRDSRSEHSPNCSQMQMQKTITNTIMPHETAPPLCVCVCGVGAAVSLVWFDVGLSVSLSNSKRRKD